MYLRSYPYMFFGHLSCVPVVLTVLNLSYISDVLLGGSIVYVLGLP